MARLHWLEAILPLGIIGGMLCIMGNAQYFIHKAAHGRPKHIGNDMWDIAMKRRDKKLIDQASALWGWILISIDLSWMLTKLFKRPRTAVV